MTNCAGEFSLQELSSLPIGTLAIMRKGCASANIPQEEALTQLKKGGFAFPENKEFSWGGTYGSCLIDAERGPPCDTEIPGSGNPGNRGTVTRTSYLGSPPTCCIEQEAVVGEYTCDPKFLTDFNTSSNCDPYMYVACNNYLLTKSPTEDPKIYNACSNWVLESIKNGRPDANAFMKRACTLEENQNTSLCKDWCAIGNNQTEYGEDACFKPNPFPIPIPGNLGEGIIDLAVSFCSSMSSVCFSLICLILLIMLVRGN